MWSGHKANWARSNMPSRDPRKAKRTNAVFFSTPYMDAQEALLIGDSIIKKVTGISNTQVLGFRGMKIEELTGLFAANQIPNMATKSLIITHIGTNNINRDSDSDLIERMKTLIGTIKFRYPQAEIVISHVIPRPVDYAVTADKVKRFNEAIEAKKATWNIKTIQTYRAMQHDRTPIWSYYQEDDRLHPNPLGDGALREYLCNKIGRIRYNMNIPKATFPPPETIVLGKRQNKRRR